MRVIIISICLVLLSGCATGPRIPSGSKGNLLFSIRIIETDSGGILEKDEGIFFYENDRGVVTGYNITRGRITAVVNISADDLRDELDKIAFETFNFETELARAIARRDAEYADEVMGPFALHGAEYEIRFTPYDQTFTLRRWNPAIEIEGFSSYSPKIAKLKALIDAFARLYGRSEFRF